MSTPSPDLIVEKSVALLRARSEVGIEKYGVTLDYSPAEIAERVRHLKEELADALNYAVWAEDFLTKPCVWRKSKGFKGWETGCGYPVKTVRTKMNFCPKCGRKLEEAK